MFLLHQRSLPARLCLITAFVFLVSGCFTKKKKDPREEIAIKSHSGPVTSVAFSPDGQILASSSEDRTVRLFHLENGLLSTTIPPELSMSPLFGYGEGFSSISFSSDSSSLFAGEYQFFRGGVVNIFDLETGERFSELEVSPSFLNSISVHPTEALLACGFGDDFGGTSLSDFSDDSVSIFSDDIYGGVEEVSFSPDGTLLASVGLYDTIRIHSIPDGDLLISTGYPSHHPVSLSFSPDGRFLATVGDDQLNSVSTFRGVIYVWEVSTGEMVRFIEVSRLPLRTLRFSPGGDLWAAAGEDALVYMVGAHSHVVLDSMRGHVEPVNTLSFSPDGQVLVSGSDDNYVRWWDISGFSDTPDTDSLVDSESVTSSEDTSTSLDTETIPDSDSSIVSESDSIIDTDTPSLDSSILDSDTSDTSDSSSDMPDAGFDGGYSDTETIIDTGFISDTESESDTNSETSVFWDGGDDSGLDASL